MNRIRCSSSLIPACVALVVACSSEPSSVSQESSDGGGTGGQASGGGGAYAGGQNAGGQSAGGQNAGGQSAGGNSSAGVGGSVASGGTGASSSAGSGGVSTGGNAGGTLSSGCGAIAPTSGRHTIDVNGTMREYVLDVPVDYDASEPHWLIFGWHWRGGKAQDVVANQYYGLKPLSKGTAIFVSPEGLVDNNVTGWANPQGRDIDFAKAMVAEFESTLCIDQSRIFSVGFSYGAMMSEAVGCAMGDVFRAIAPFAGALYSGCENGTHPIAMWGTHGYADGADGVVPIADGRAARDEFLERNGCSTDTTPVAPDECVSYQGCSAGYPVTWCEWNGGHWWPSFSSKAVWDFFSALP